MPEATCCCDFAARKRSFPYVSAADVLAGQSRARLCATRSSSSELRRSEHARSSRLRSIRCLPASRYKATVADNLLQQDFLRRSPVGTVLDSATALVLGVGLAVVVTAAGVTAGVAGGGDRSRRSVVELGIAALVGRAVHVPASSGVGVVSALAAMTFGEIHGRAASR